MRLKPEHHSISVVPKQEETLSGWRAFSVIAVKPDGDIIRWSLYERSPDPRATREGPALAAA
jgi:hypothetical protein